MPDRLLITLPIRPFGKARPRAVPRGKGRYAKVSVMMPDEYVAKKKAATLHLSAALRQAGWRRAPAHTEVVGVRVIAYHHRPKDPPKWMAGQGRAEHREIWRTGRTLLRLATPDADNLEGAIWDALNDTGQCWHDDSQAVSLGCWSWYAAPGEPARVEVELQRGSWLCHPAWLLAAIDAEVTP